MKDASIERLIWTLQEVGKAIDALNESEAPQAKSYASANADRLGALED